MDDYSTNSLQDSRNEWCARLVNILTPLMIEGFNSIFDEAWKLCEENDEQEKYLMTFQNLISRVPKWNPAIIEEEKKRVIDKSACSYLEDLITCVHIIQLKSLTCMRVGQKQKKIDISIPSLDDFIHKIYINAARKIYTNVYLFEKGIIPLQIQKHNRELEIITKEAIMNTIRDNIPVEKILRAYMDESVEEDIQVEEKEEIISQTPVKVEEPKVENAAAVEAKATSVDKVEDKSVVNIEKKPGITVNDAVTETNTFAPDDIKKEVTEGINEEMTSRPLTPSRLTFNNIDKAMGDDKKEEEIVAPKTDERLEKISEMRHVQRKEEEEEEDDDDDDEKIKIGSSLNLGEMDVQTIGGEKKLNTDPIINDIEVLT